MSALILSSLFSLVRSLGQYHVILTTEVCHIQQVGKDISIVSTELGPPSADTTWLFEPKCRSLASSVSTDGFPNCKCRTGTNFGS